MWVGVCSSLNMVAFAKIMKKYDKVGRHRFGPLYSTTEKWSIPTLQLRIRYLKIYHRQLVELLGLLLKEFCLIISGVLMVTKLMTAFLV
jgi:hypothetical protein